jgi:hypothetical protein
MSTGWQASCAADGTATPTASERGIQRASIRLRGPASTSSPAVASTESTNP